MSSRGAPWATLAYPSLMLGLFLLAPFTCMLAFSVFRRIQAGTFEPALVIDNYAALISSAAFGGQVLHTIAVAATVAAVAVLLGFPFTYRLSRLPRRSQVRWLVLLLSILALSEVIIGFAWSVLLSRSAGVSNLLVWAGLLDRAISWTPGSLAMHLGLIYLTFPYTVLVLYPSLIRLDPAYAEAARTMGAPPLRAFLEVVVPISRKAIVAALLMAFVFALGAYVIPQLLGRPQHWTLAVHITDQALGRSNVPAAAAMSMLLLAASLAIVLVTMRGAGRAGSRRGGVDA